MSVNLYDQAVTDKINSWLPKARNKSIKVLSPEETARLFSIEADEKNDEPLSLPLVAISRDNTIEILQKTMTPMSFDGLMLDATTKKTLQLDGIPININYQLDIYTRFADEALALVREFMFKLINNPQINIELPYNNQHFKHVSSLIMEEQIEDTSAISERLFPGQFSRWTLRFRVDGAYMFNLPYVDNVHMELGPIEIKNYNQEIYEKEQN